MVESAEGGELARSGLKVEAAKKTGAVVAMLGGHSWKGGCWLLREDKTEGLNLAVRSKTAMPHRFSRVETRS